MKQQKFYLYRFMGKNNEIIYIGRTNNLVRRILKEHFTVNTHLPPDCYLEVEKVEFAEFANESEEVAYEAILINQLRPKYNTQFKDDAQFCVQIPTIIWKEFEWEYTGQFEAMKLLKQPVVSISDSICGAYEQISIPSDGNFMSFGFSQIDKMVALPPCSTAMIAAQSGMYKTAYALHIATMNASRNRKVMYINLKDSIENLSYRLISMESCVPLTNIQFVNLTEDEWKMIAASCSSLNNLSLSFYNRTVSGCKIEDIGRVIKERLYDLVIIDDLNSIEDFDNSYDTDKTLRSMKYLKGLAIETRCSIISLFCLESKDISKRIAKRPMLSDLGYSSLQSYNDSIQFLYLQQNEIDVYDTVEIIVAKNNIGTIGTVEVVPHSGTLIALEKGPE